jgi:hypothetical protein
MVLTGKLMGTIVRQRAPARARTGRDRAHEIPGSNEVPARERTGRRSMNEPLIVFCSQDFGRCDATVQTKKRPELIPYWNVFG